MFNSFWWGHSANNGRGLHWLSWEHLSVSKDYGGGCKWSIGTGEKINIWEQNWLNKGLSITTPPNTQVPDNYEAQHRTGIAGNWNIIWQAKIPPKVKNLLWRIGRNVLPTQARLTGKKIVYMCCSYVRGSAQY
ncbi:pentatricopeptide repeat-containing protein [Trifolium pratense]|uniref:Pentatricopeptide repeat-containing protein n=1 Tax=Trifolium pratense TaxID=57577 RepID=A0A2K3NX17_TRIPR|nr:pentatricopeptide repeat-containing protein [Trifolium pratense]